MYYEKVKRNFFNYPEWYRELYNILNDGDIFIEIGTWTGASSLFFAELMMNGGKKIDFYTIDTFEGSKSLPPGPEKRFYAKTTILDGLYEYYMSVREPLKDYIKVIKGDSQINETSSLFPDGSVAAIFIDGDHSHAGVARDLDNWYPKIREGGIMSGHDYIWGGHGVKPVVDSFSEFKATEFHIGDVWYYEK